MTTETASVLFTDLVGSTELQQQLGEERSDELRRTHDQLLTAAVDEAGGRVVKGLGDGIMAVFTSAADAVTAAVDVQRAAERHARQFPEEAFEVRVGVSVGDVSLEDDDYFGTAVIEASRLCASAQGGQILVADLVRALTRGRGGFIFDSIGELELKGLDAPVAACLVAWEPATLSEHAGQVPFPALLAAPNTVPYTGRLGLLADLNKAWDFVVGGEGSRTVLLVGEPGVGKTRTSTELARKAHEAGALVLYGRCDEGLGLSYEPFVEALDWQTAHDPALPLGRFSGDLRRLVPDLETRLSRLPPAIKSDANAEQHRLFEATASWLAEASRESGLVLVVDDLHWATKPTLQLFLHVARASAADPGARLLLLATYRDTDVDRVHPLSDVLGDLRLLPGVERLPVEGLSEGEVLDFVTEAAGHELDDNSRALARRVHAETEGNPFFASEVLRHFIETKVVRLDEGRWVVTNPEHVDVPEGVRDVVGRRLNRLSEQANEVLTVASVVGREFALDVVAVVAEVDADGAMDALDQALRARLVVEAGVDRFRFAHALTRQTLYEELSSTRRRRLHRAVADVLELKLPADVASLAHHSVEAGPIGGDLSRAIRYTLAAGEQALETRAVADAATYFNQTLELLEDTQDPNPADGLRARCGLGEVQRDSGDPGFRETLLEVTAGALAIGEVDLATRAAVANGRVISSIVGATDHERVAQLEAVVDALGADKVAERAVLLSALSSELMWEASLLERRLALADEAIELVEGSDDSGLVARVLIGTGTPINIPSRVERLPDSRQRAIDAADQAGDPTLRVLARVQLGFAFHQHGRVSEARDVIREARRLADDEGNPTIQWMARCFDVQHLAWDGDLAKAREENKATLEFGQQIGEPDATNWWGGIEIGIMFSDRTLVNAIDLFAAMAVEFPGNAGWPLTQGAALTWSGRHDDARDLLDRYGLANPLAIPQDFFTLTYWQIASEMYRTLGLTESARVLGVMIAPYREFSGTSGVWVNGPMTLALADCHAAAGEVEAALECALLGWQVALDSPVRPVVPTTAARVAGTLRALGTEEATDKAKEIAHHGLAEAEAMGLDLWVAELTEIIDDLNAA